MHELGFVHRDISLSNILLDLNSFEVKLVDFGFVAEDESKSHVGKSEYQPPEVATVELSKVIWTKAGDIYSIGILLFKILFGVQFDILLLHN